MVRELDVEHVEEVHEDVDVKTVTMHQRVWIQSNRRTDAKIIPCYRECQPAVLQPLFWIKTVELDQIRPEPGNDGTEAKS